MFRQGILELLAMTAYKNQWYTQSILDMRLPKHQGAVIPPLALTLMVSGMVLNPPVESTSTAAGSTYNGNLPKKKGNQMTQVNNWHEVAA